MHERTGVMTNTAAQLQSSASSVSRVTTMRRISYRVGGALAAILLAIVGLAVGASPANAAPPAGRINACFRYSMAGGTGPWTKVATVDYYNSYDGQWYVARNYSLNDGIAANGCMSLLVPSGYYFRVRVSSRPFADSGSGSSKNVYCSGISNYAYVKTGYTYSLGTVWVNCG